MAERLNGRISGEALGIDIHWHRALEPPLRGFNMAHNARCQRVLGRRTPNKTIAEHPKA